MEVQVAPGMREAAFQWHFARAMAIPDGCRWLKDSRLARISRQDFPDECLHALFG